MNLKVIEGGFSVCRFESSAVIPSEVYQSKIFSITKTDEELSIVCETSCIYDADQKEDGWAMIKVQGPLDFSLTGVLASLAAPLAEREVSVFAISTFDTDYLLVKQNKLGIAKEVLEVSGFEFTL